MSKKQVMAITGSSRSVGKHLAKYYVSKGFQVIGCSRHPVDFTLKNYQHFCLDVADEKKVKEMFEAIEKKYNRLDVLINNAGVMSTNYALAIPLDAVQDMLNTNFIGTFLCSREAIQLMRKNKFGRIINMSTIAVPLKSIGTSIYGASKVAIEHFGMVLAKEVASLNIHVNTLALSFVKNSGMAQKISAKATEEGLGQTISKAWLDFNDISQAMDFLIAKENKIMGETFTLGGV